MDEETFNELADKLAVNLKSEKDVSEMARMLTKAAIERALEIEMEEHPGEKSNGRRKNQELPKRLLSEDAKNRHSPRFHSKSQGIETLTSSRGKRRNLQLQHRGPLHWPGECPRFFTPVLNTAT